MSEKLLSAFTSLGVGGRADVTVVRDTFDVRDDDVILGRGTNVVVSDLGVDRRVLVVRCGGVEAAGTRLTAGGGLPLSAVARAACASGLSGLEWAVGIPGSVGGAVVMNAGAFGGCMADVVSSAVVKTPRGERRLTAEEMRFGYRNAELPFGVVTRVTFRLAAGSAADALALADGFNARRRAEQPSGRTAGSTFLACGNVSAGYYIDRAGLKGCRVGGARISEKHANFIIMDEGGRADDFRRLADTVKLKVYSRFNVRLKEEVRYIGEFR